MSVDIAAGDAHLQLPTLAYSFWSWTDAVTNVPISAASAANPRVDTVVCYVDTAVTTTSSVNSPGSFKFQAIAGTASGTPVPATDSAIQATLGSTVAWLKLATVLVDTNATSILGAKISDARSSVKAIAPAQNIAWGGFPRFKVTRVASQGFPRSSTTKVRYDTVTYSLGGATITTAAGADQGVFICTTPGVYHFDANMIIADDPVSGGIGIYLNGTQVDNGTNGANRSFPGETISTDLSLAVNDKVEIRWSNTQTARDPNMGGNSFSGHLVAGV